MLGFYGFGAETVIGFYAIFHAVESLLLLPIPFHLLAVERHEIEDVPGSGRTKLLSVLSGAARAHPKLHVLSDLF